MGDQAPRRQAEPCWSGMTKTSGPVGSQQPVGAPRYIFARYKMTKKVNISQKKDFEGGPNARDYKYSADLLANQV